VSAYLPDLTTFWLTAAVLGATLLVGFGISRLPAGRWARLAAWTLLIAATAGIERLCDHEPAGFRMLVIIGALFLGMKMVVSVETCAAGQPALSPLRWLAFTTAWPGMRPALFARAGGPPLPGVGELIETGLLRLVLGAALIGMARLTWVAASDRLPELAARIMATLPLLIGLSLVLHLGIFNILTGLWRRAGVDCRPLFRAPLASRSLAEFWGRRWNLAFSEMTAIGVYRPLEGRVGRRAATLLAFVGSGLAHELAISVPVGAGYGLPMLYFLLHGGLVLFEKCRERQKRPIDALGWRARVWTLGWLAVPLPILFHPWFLAGVVWPLIGM
jgi:alginate O-acetyltransferase complex protein AlgI